MRSYLHSSHQTLLVPLPVCIVGRPGLRIAGPRSLLDSWTWGNTPKYIQPHMMANDIVCQDSYQWHMELQEAVYYLKAKYPSDILIWSDMLPRQRWRYRCQ